MEMISYMKKTIKFTIAMFLMLCLCACGSKEAETETESIGTDVAVSDVEVSDGAMQYDNNVTIQYSENEPEEVPFQVLIDKLALENGSKDSDIVTIITDLTEWDYTVNTDYGKITDKKQASFVYNRPEGKDDDTIIVSLTNKENAKEYKTVIPLLFIEPINEVTISYDFN